MKHAADIPSMGDGGPITFERFSSAWDWYPCDIAAGFLIFRSEAARYILKSCEAAIELTLQSLDAGCR